MRLKGIRRSLVVSITGGLVLALLFEGRHLLEWKDFFRSWLLNFLLFFSLMEANGGVVSFIQGKISWKERPVLAFFVNLTATVIVTLLVFVVVMIPCLYWLYGMPWEKIWSFIPQLNFHIAIIITVLISLFLHGRAFLLSWRASDLEAARLQKAEAEARYEALRNQVNPHFLFNSLNVLSGLLYTDVELADEFIQQLSRNYRYVLETRNREMVSLEEEMQAIDTFLFLAETRFREKLEVDIAVPVEDRKRFNMAPLSLQMLVENAIKHNEISQAKPLQVQIKLEEDWLIVSNNYQPKQHRGESLGVGLDNIQRRYRYLTEQEVVVKQKDGIFEVHLPLLKNEAAAYRRQAPVPSS